MLYFGINSWSKKKVFSKASSTLFFTSLIQRSTVLYVKYPNGNSLLLEVTSSYECCNRLEVLFHTSMVKHLQQFRNYGKLNVYGAKQTSLIQISLIYNISPISTYSKTVVLFCLTSRYHHYQNTISDHNGVATCF